MTIETPAPLPLPDGARLFRLVTTRRVTHIMATSVEQATAVFTRREWPLTVPPAPRPAEEEHRGPDGILRREPTPAWLAWHQAYAPLLFHRIDWTAGECLVRVEPAGDVHVPQPFGPEACRTGQCRHPAADRQET